MPEKVPRQPTHHILLSTGRNSHVKLLIGGSRLHSANHPNRPTTSLQHRSISEPRLTIRRTDQFSAASITKEIKQCRKGSATEKHSPRVFTLSSILAKPSTKAGSNHP